MARQRYRGNTLAASFPLLSSFSGQTVVIPGIDQYYMRGVTGGVNEPGIPQVVFMENVMPMANGLQSIDFTQAIIGGLEVDYDKAFYLRDSDERRTLFVPANGKNYTYDFITQRWASQPISVPFGVQVSVAAIKGRQFVCYAQSLILEWNGLELVPIVLDGLNVAEIIGLVSANAYLIAYTEKRILWSSILDPTDFVPSEENFAGGTDVLALKGRIVTCTPISNGFNIYTTANIIVALYTANNRFPWTFNEIAGGAGIEVAEKVTNDSSDLFQFAITVAGVVTLNRSQATQVFPEVTEFFSARRYESFNFSTRRIEEFNINTHLNTKLCFICSRYLVFSYGENGLTHALIYDTALKRWGKIRIDHVDCFEYIDNPSAVSEGSGLRYIDLIGTYADQTKLYIQFGKLTLGTPLGYIDLTETYEELTVSYAALGGILIQGVVQNLGQEPLKCIGFLKENGTVHVINFDLPTVETKSVLFLGKYQLQRGRFTSLHEVWLENVSAEKTTRLSVLKSYDGFNNERAISLFKDKEISRGRLQKYLDDGAPFMNCILQLEGNFDLNSLEMVFSSAGYR